MKPGIREEDRQTEDEIARKKSWSARDTRRSGRRENDAAGGKKYPQIRRV